MTGDPPAFVTTWAEVRAPGLKYSSASAPASRAAGTEEIARGKRVRIRVDTRGGISNQSMRSASPHELRRAIAKAAGRRLRPCVERLARALRRRAAKQFVLVGLVVDAVEIRASNDGAGVPGTRPPSRSATSR